MFNKKIIPNIYISFEATLKCNMRCPYCYNLKRLSNEDNNLTIFKFFIYRLKKILKKNPNKTFEIDFLGGEPTISKNIAFFVNSIIDLSKEYSNIIYITITTNCLNKFEYNFKQSKLLNFEVTYHNIVNFNNFVDTLFYIYRHNQNILITFNLHIYKFNIEHIKDILTLTKDKIKCSYIMIYEENNKYLNNDIIKEIDNFIEINDIEKDSLSMNRYNNKQWDNTLEKCRLLKLNILYNGEISSSCGHKIYNMNILKNDLPLFEIIKCNGKSCEGDAGLDQKNAFIKELNEEISSTIN